MEKQLNAAVCDALELEDKQPSMESIHKMLTESKDLIGVLAKKNEFVLVVIQIITDAFYLLSTENFDEPANHRVEVCINILRLLAEDSEFKAFFIDSQMDFYIYPFLLADTEESLRISTLLLFYEILRDGMPFSMHGSELLPLLLKIVDFGSERSQWLSLDALRLILQGSGLDYAVQTLDRFQAIDVVLSALFPKCVASQNNALLKILFRIYIRLCDKGNVKAKIKEKTPECIFSKDAQAMCSKDEELRELHAQFLQILK